MSDKESPNIESVDDAFVRKFNQFWDEHDEFLIWCIDNNGHMTEDEWDRKKATEFKRRGLDVFFEEKSVVADTDPIYCHGWRYNFKKGIEHCKNRLNCPVHVNYLKDGQPCYEKYIRFNSIKDFRECKRYLENESNPYRMELENEKRRLSQHK